MRGAQLYKRPYILGWLDRCYYTISVDEPSKSHCPGSRGQCLGSLHIEKALSLYLSAKFCSSGDPHKAQFQTCIAWFQLGVKYAVLFSSV